MRARIGIICGVLLAVAVIGCEEKKKTKDQLYFKDLTPPLGIKVKIIKDISKNPKGGGVSIVRTSVEPDVDRDDLDRLMRSFFRQTKARSGFSGGTVSKIDIRFYTSEAAAKAEGENWLASVQRSSTTAAPKFVNKQKLPLLKWAKKALARTMVLFKKGKVQPRILADPKALALEISLPFVKGDGSGDLREKVTFITGTRVWVGLVLPLFRKIEQLEKVTYIGTGKGNKVLFKVRLSREQLQQLELRKVQEGLGAFQGKLINKRLAKQITDKQFSRLTAKQTKKVYKKVLSRLPKDQVMVDKSLR